MNYIALQKQIQQNHIHNSYLFIAEDRYIADSYISLLKKKRINLFPEVNFNHFYLKKVTMGDVFFACETPPVMSENRIVLLEDKAIAKYPEAMRELSKYVENPFKTTILIIYTESIDKRSVLYKTMQKLDSVVDFKKMTYQELLLWTQNAFEKRGMSIGKDALRYFLESMDYTSRQSEIDLGYIVSEIEKIRMYDLKMKKVSLEDVKKICTLNVNENIFTLCDALLSGNQSLAFKQMYRLNYNRVPYPVILSAVSNNIRSVCISQAAFENGKNEAMIARDYHLHPFVVKKALQTRKFFSVHDGKKALLELYEIDIRLKNAKLDSDTAMCLMVTDITTKVFSLIQEKNS